MSCIVLAVSVAFLPRVYSNMHLAAVTAICSVLLGSDALFFHDDPYPEMSMDVVSLDDDKLYSCVDVFS